MATCGGGFLQWPTWYEATSLLDVLVLFRVYTERSKCALTTSHSS